jgi:hypothetical protein
MRPRLLLNRAVLAGFAVLAGCDGGPQSSPQARMALLAAGRGQGVSAPPGPAWHFRALGRVIFPAEPAPLQQDAELWVGGPDRIRYLMTASDGGGRNIFLLDGAAGCWLRTNADPWRTWESAELLAESVIRWEILRFPWGWSDEIAAADPGATSFHRVIELGEFFLEIGADGLPAAAGCAGVRAEVSDWRVLSQGARIAPFHWAWSGPSGHRAEEFDELREDLRFFDEAFRPPPAAGGAGAQVRSSASERLGVIRARLLPAASAEEDPAMDAASWWWHEGQRVAARLDLVPSIQPQDGEPAPPAIAEEWWLRWSYVAPSQPAEQTAAELLQAAKQAGLEVRGTPWVRESLMDGRAHGQIALVAVTRPK